LAGCPHAGGLLLPAASLTPVIDPIPSIPPTTAAKDKVAARKRFEAVYSIICDDLLTDFRKHNMPEESIEYYRRVRNSRIYASLALSSSPIHHPTQSMDYNVPGGKLNRGLSVVDSVAILKGRELTDSEYFKAAVLGWAVEWVRLFLFPLPRNTAS